MSMEEKLARQLRLLQALVLLLTVAVALLIVNCFHPLLSMQRFKAVEAGRVEIREANGTLKAALSNAAGFNVGQRAEQAGGNRLSGLIFYNEEGEETGGLVYQGKAIPGGQDSDVGLTMDQYHQDQNVYLHHTEYKDAHGSKIDDGLQINERPDWTGIKAEYWTYAQIAKLPPEQADALRLKALQDGTISMRRLFFGVTRGVENQVPYNDAGVFIKNKWGRNAIKIYVDNDNKPHFEVYDPLGEKIVYELKIPK
jgi:hypothetical protein